MALGQAPTELGYQVTRRRPPMPIQVAAMPVPVVYHKHRLHSQSIKTQDRDSELLKPAEVLLPPRSADDLHLILASREVSKAHLLIRH